MPLLLVSQKELGGGELEEQGTDLFLHRQEASATFLLCRWRTICLLCEECESGKAKVGSEYSGKMPLCSSYKALQLSVLSGKCYFYLHCSGFCCICSLMVE